MSESIESLGESIMHEQPTAEEEPTAEDEEPTAEEEIEVMALPTYTCHLSCCRPSRLYKFSESRFCKTFILSPLGAGILVSFSIYMHALITAGAMDSAMQTLAHAL